MKFTVRLLTIAFIACLTACGSDSSVPAPQHLYVGNDSNPGAILQYTLPITSASTPSATVAANNVMCLTVDAAGNVVSGDLSGNLSVFNAPITSASTPAATFSNGTYIGQILLDSTDDLLVTNQGGSMNLFLHPLSSSSTVSQTISPAGITSIFGAALDSAANLVITANFNALAVIAPPYTGTPTVAPAALASGAGYRKIAIHNGQVFATFVNAGTGGIDVYNLPITSTSSPTFTMTNVDTPETVAFDAGGNLYVGNLGDSTIRVFTPPFAASSTPSVTLTLPSPFAVFGIAIGK